MATSEIDLDTSSDQIEVVTFRLDGNWYSIPVSQISSVIDPKNTTRVPRTSSSVEGVMDYRGEVAVIIELAEVLGVDNNGEYDFRNIIILDDDLDNQTVGVVTDEVFGVRSFSTDDLEKPVENDDDTSRVNLLGGTFTVEDEDTKVIELVNVEAVLQRVTEESRIEFQQAG